MRLRETGRAGARLAGLGFLLSLGLYLPVSGWLWTAIDWASLGMVIGGALAVYVFFAFNLASVLGQVTRDAGVPWAARRLTAAPGCRDGTVPAGTGAVLYGRQSTAGCRCGWCRAAAVERAVAGGTVSLNGTRLGLLPPEEQAAVITGLAAIGSMGELRYLGPPPVFRYASVPVTGRRMLSPLGLHLMPCEACGRRTVTCGVPWGIPHAHVCGTCARR